MKSSLEVSKEEFAYISNERTYISPIKKLSEYKDIYSVDDVI